MGDDKKEYLHSGLKIFLVNMPSFARMFWTSPQQNLSLYAPTQTLLKIPHKYQGVTYLITLLPRSPVVSK